MKKINDYIEEMTSEERYHWFCKISEKALAQYDVGETTLHYCGRSEHVTFHVQSQKADQFLLRLHIPYSEIRDKIWLKRETVQSELIWLNALHHETDLIVQEPIPNRANHFVSQVSSNNFQETINVSLLRWLEGHTLDKISEPILATRLGALTARLHEHGSQWKLPAGFVRPRYDAKWLHASLMRLRPGVRAKIISEADFAIIEEAGQRIAKLMKSLGETEQMWGLIHGDLTPANCLLDGEEVRVIDFGCSGFGYHLYDIAWALTCISKEQRRSFLKGYQIVRQLPSDYEHMIGAFLIAYLINSLFFWVETDPEEATRVSSNLAKDTCPSYFEGKASSLITSA